MKEEILKEFEEFGELYSFPFGLTNSVMGYKFEKDGSNSPISRVIVTGKQIGRAHV